MLSLKKRVVYWLILVLIACGVEARMADNRHVLIIGIDGCRFDALKRARTPHIDALIGNGAVSYSIYAGGELGKGSEQTTYSGPGWSSLLTGVWHDKHGVSNNDFSHARLDKYLPLYSRLRTIRPEMQLHSIVHWGPINNYILTAGDYLAQYNTDFEVAAAASLDLLSHNPDVLFVHFDDVDGAGSSGFSPDNPIYLMAIEKTDVYIGEILSALKKRSQFNEEDWLILVVTDHGGYKRAHGGQTPEERGVFMIANGGRYHDGVEFHKKQGQTSLMPTILDYFGIRLNPDWEFEETPLGN